MGIFKSWVNQEIGSTDKTVSKFTQRYFSQYKIIAKIKVNIEDVKAPLDKKNFPDECWCIIYDNNLN